MAKYDIGIIGGGPGGYVAAIRAAQLGAKVCVVEKDGVLGGTCLNRGCIPTKAILHSAKIYRTFKNTENFGINISDITLNYEKIINRKNQIVNRLTKGIEFLFKSNDIKIIKGKGEIASSGIIKATDNSEQFEVETDNIIIATGSEPMKLANIPTDGEIIQTSREVLSCENLPGSILIIGAGVIGCEFADIFNSFGVKVRLVEMMTHILPEEDNEIAGKLENIFKKKGIEVFTQTKVNKVEKRDSAANVYLSGDKTFEVDRVLVAVGRSSNISGIGLEENQIKLDKNRILVNEYMQTNIPHIYAVGDITPGPMLAHVASKEGIVAVEHIMGMDSKMDYKAIPSCVYTDPEVAGVGLTEQKAKETHEIKIGRFPLMASGKAMCIGETEGLVKIIADKDTDEILGVRMIAPHATELIAECVLAIKAECTYRELAETIHAHPTLSEAVMEAAEDVDNIAISLPKKH
ncbi:MAG: dihydrolipoyl dehydrogenase [bacterium]|nr:dihydrolipoyl dehydrogenase [bacterium]